MSHSKKYKEIYTKYKNIQMQILNIISGVIKFLKATNKLTASGVNTSVAEGLQQDVNSPIVGKENLFSQKLSRSHSNLIN